MEIKPRIYLSGPITGVENYKQSFDQMEEQLKGIGYTRILNPAWLDMVITEGQYEEYMSACLNLIDICDIVVMLPGWEKSAGANREMGYALGKGKLVIDWEKRGEEWR